MALDTNKLQSIKDTIVKGGPEVVASMLAGALMAIDELNAELQKTNSVEKGDTDGPLFK